MVLNVSKKDQKLTELFLRQTMSLILKKSVMVKTWVVNRIKPVQVIS